MKVKSITNYNDLRLNRLVTAGEELEVEDARATILINAKVAVAIKAPTTPEVVTKPKRARKKVEG